MMDQEIVYTDEVSVFCSGRDVPLDHPKVYLEINPKSGDVTCPYCSKKFVKNEA